MAPPWPTRSALPRFITPRHAHAPILVGRVVVRACVCEWGTRLTAVCACCCPVACRLRRPCWAVLAPLGPLQATLGQARQRSARAPFHSITPAKCPPFAALSASSRYTTASSTRLSDTSFFLRVAARVCVHT